VFLVDLIFLILLVASAVGGYRRGATLQVFELLGLGTALGVVLLVAPLVGSVEMGERVRVAIVAAIVLGAGVAGVLGGRVLGERVRKRLPDEGGRLDRSLGAVVSVAALIVATWFLAVNLSRGPLPDLAASLRTSGVVRLLGGALPAPPPLIPALERSAERLGFDDPFVGLPPVPGPPVEDPPPAVVDAAGQAALPSTIEVLGRGCVPDYLNQGSGFVVAPGYLVTNAHVVAGTHGVFLYDGDRHPATVVAIDRAMDLAVLHVPSYSAPPLRLTTAEQARGTGGAVVGFVRGYNPRIEPAAVRGVIVVHGRDIDGDRRVERRIYELQTDVFGGDSGGPFALADGSVAGVVFADSVVEDGVAYAIRSADVQTLLDRAVGATEPVDTGACTAR
jgi:S1-C subfamily serine protease